MAYENITKEHIIKAVKKIEAKQSKPHLSRDYDVVVNGNHYPFFLFRYLFLQSKYPLKTTITPTKPDRGTIKM